MRQNRFVLSLCLLLLVLSSLLTSLAQDDAGEDTTPELVVVPGSFQDEVGCSGEWQPDCTETELIFNESSGFWENSFVIPAGSYEYKVALDGSWDINYGADGLLDGANIPLVLEEETEVSFVYDHSTGLVQDSVGTEITVTPAEPMAQPDIVNIPGTIQPVLGCPGEWAPDCEATFLELDEATGIWEGTFAVPAGGYEYKVAINGGWDENYGGLADAGGPNIVLNVPEDQDVTFLYDHESNWIMDTVRHQLVTAPGSYQDELGCANEWAPECMLSWLQDVDGDGIYTLTTRDIPAGDYEAKVAINRSWDENYGLNGEADGANITFTVPEDGEPVTFTFDSDLNTMVISIGGGSVSGANLRERTAHWVLGNTIAWAGDIDLDYDYKLLYSADASLSVSVFGLDGEYEAFDLNVNADGLPADVIDKFPHLAGFAAMTLSDDALNRIGELLMGQTVVAAFRDDQLADLTGLQIPGVLDDLYTYDGDLGLTFAEDGTPTITVWAPTAQNVSFNLYSDFDPNSEAQTFDMTRDAETGTWSITGEADWYLQYYTFNVTVYAPTELAIVENEVTDPYSLALSQNSTRSMIVDLTDPTLMPEGWQTLEKPDYGDHFEDITIYELHVRDFSIFDESVPEDLRGTYLAFTQTESNGMQHLAGLSQAGMTHLHLLPSFDIATINENRARHLAPDYEEMVALPPDSEEQQALQNQYRNLDGFNWGYDPYHFMAQEGSYATDANSTARITEYREMVQAVNNIGLRLVQDVVFNHTNASGQSERSVLDRVVPGYYHRLDASGRVTRSTCCENTATEHNMMRRLMIDTVILNAVHYKIDGFRFDLMGHHMLSDMIEVREAVDALTLENDGVDGSEIYIYGEGWNFGEVQDDTRGVNATQFNAAGTGIGTFNDRLRDAVRGGSPFGDRDKQGLGNGAYVLPNGMAPENESLDRALLFADQTRIGLAGNLQNYTFEDRTGEQATGLDIDYNGSPAGYTLDPQENIIYVSKHDNETLYDNILFRLPDGLTAADVTRMQNASLSYVAFAQGVPFFHAASDMLRSKSLDRNSYDSGDWFNRIDWTYQTNNFGVGLPPAQDNSERWELMATILANEALNPSPEDIMLNLNVFREWLQIRYSSPLFRLTTAEAVQERVAFHNTGEDQVPGVIVMSLSDRNGENLDPAHEMIVVVFNSTPEALSFTVDALGDEVFTLHPVQQDSYDAVAQTATFDAGTFNVPAWTTSVFVLPE